MKAANSAGAPTWFFLLSASNLLSCLLLGGGTKGGFLSDAILELCSIPLFLTALWRLADAAGDRNLRWALTFCGLMGALIAAQLIPLPPGIWVKLPGRGPILGSLDLIDRRSWWATISMAPSSSWLSALSLLPPAAIFFSVLTIDWRERRHLSLLIIVVAVTSAFLGLLQLAGGPNSSLRFFQITNESSPVGFFANRNHFAALLYCAFLLSAAWVPTVFGDLQFSLFRQNRRKFLAEAPVIAGAVAIIGALLVLTAVVVMTRSRAGLVLTFGAIVGALALQSDSRHKQKPKIWITLWTMISVTVLAVLFLGRSDLVGSLERFDISPLADERQVFARVTLEGVKTLMPVGAGLGTFVAAYPMFAKRDDLVPITYANHAHNDLLELLLETGLAGALLLVLFVYWLVRRGINAWGPQNLGPLPIDQSLMRAAILIIGLLLAHSLVDYPLRTTAMMTILGFSSALLIRPAILRSAFQEQDGVRNGFDRPRRRAALAR
jgi:hypothetical protein